ncbi:hypothetical protein SAMN05216199_3560 [Pedococcus cremeus]|uniref:Uncharacterized protein n=1 Tax=Pedococcus cremeus TaxID=587636 RepID=A0A1H9XA00_9MICO|nr:hypothetical protein [Pedococcus cremeus]SES43026.1 hypothetical protein SAMN05216199_3560 [Pedococcus cremeus]
MRLPKRDLIATALVAAAVALYLLWLLDATLPGMSNIRVTGLAILALGFAASASAVVPGFAQLVHGNKTYLAATTLLGLVAFAGGLAMVLWASSAGLGVLVATMAVLWAIATIHHLRLSKGQSEPTTQIAVAPREHHLSNR